MTGKTITAINTRKVLDNLSAKLKWETKKKYEYEKMLRSK